MADVRDVALCFGSLVELSPLPFAPFVRIERGELLKAGSLSAEFVAELLVGRNCTQPEAAPRGKHE